MKKLMMLTMSVMLIAFFAGCEDDNNDNGNGQYDAQTLALMSADGIDDANEHIYDALDYVDGFSPDVPALLRGLDIMLEPVYDPATGWWQYDTTMSYIYGGYSQEYAIAESLMYMDGSGNFIQYPTEGVVNAFHFIEHYQMTTSDMFWDYVFDLNVEGVDIDWTSVDYTTVNGDGRWRYVYSGETFDMNISYNDLVYVWNYGTLQEYPESGSYEIAYGSYAGWVLTFDGDETAALVIYDMDGAEYNFIVNLMTGEVTGPV